MTLLMVQPILHFDSFAAILGPGINTLMFDKCLPELNGPDLTVTDASLPYLLLLPDRK